MLGLTFGLESGIFDCHGRGGIALSGRFKASARCGPQRRMNLVDHVPKSLFVRAGARAAYVRETSGGLVFECPMPWLAGPESQLLANGTETIPAADGWMLNTGSSLAGVLIGDSGVSLEKETLRIYRKMLDLTRGLNRYRIWNFIPRINAVVSGVENYVAFNSGRYRAFIEEFGGIHLTDLSAASAVGANGEALAVAFVAGQDRVENFESPLQSPSSSYPECYGENPPLFSRGSKIQGPDGITCWHLSGTASIRCSETIGRDFASQLEITLENIGRMLDVMAVPKLRKAAWKVFLRDRRDLDFCRQRLSEAYPSEMDQMLFVETDICRRDLLLEIEGTFHGPSALDSIRDHLS